MRGYKYSVLLQQYWAQACNNVEGCIRKGIHPKIFTKADIQIMKNKISIHWLTMNTTGAVDQRTSRFGDP